MQIVPDTAKILGIADPFDPEENIAAGTRYFRYLLDKYDDNKASPWPPTTPAKGTSSASAASRLSGNARVRRPRSAA